MRYFPRLSSVVANNLTTQWEITPSVARTLNFSLVVNDNKATRNQAANDAMVVTVTNDGPFAVTAPYGTVPYSAANPVTVTWNVAGTSTGTINTQNVTILLSKDAGLTFTTVLAASVPNNGSAVVNLPNENIATARIMVKSVGNIYYALNPNFFSVTSFLATAETAQTAFSIYPNPAREVVNIKMRKPSDSGSYMMYDMSGKLVTSGIIKGDTTISTEGFTTGNYVLTVTIENGETHTQKLIIQK